MPLLHMLNYLNTYTEAYKSPGQAGAVGTFYSMGIDNAFVEIDNLEVPILDGSGDMKRDDVVVVLTVAKIGDGSVACCYACEWNEARCGGTPGFASRAPSSSD